MQAVMVPTVPSPVVTVMVLILATNRPGIVVVDVNSVRVHYKSSYHVVSLSVTSSSVTVSWPKSDQVTAGLESYYRYVVEATVSGQDPKQEIIQFETGQGDQTAVISDLTHNTEYKITVRICARHNSERLNGSAGYPLTVKTKCTAPERPEIKTVTASDPGGSESGSLQVSWQTLGNSGCDYVQQLLVQYRSDPQGQWLNKSVTSLTQTTIDNLPAGVYRVRLSVTNNEGISSVSNTSPPTAVLPPDRPKIKSATAGSDPGSLQVIWETLGDSGCDNYQQLLVQYKPEHQGEWKTKSVPTLTQTQITIDNLPAGKYSVRLSVANNGDITSFSDGNVLSLPPPAAGPSPAATGPSTVTKSSSGSGVIIAVVMSLLVLIILVIVAVLLFIRLRHRVVWDSIYMKTLGARTAPEGEDDNEGTEVAAVPAASATVGPPVAPRQQVQENEVVYDNIGGHDTKVHVDELEAYIKERDTRRGGFEPEFGKLPATEMANMVVSKHPDNRPKNRFRNIWAYDTTRVVLEGDDDNPTDYINANYITGYKDRKHAYVACQGPKDTTVADMWRMIWQLKASRIVMTTQLVDCGKTKCHIYWPATVGAQEEYDQFTVTTVASEVYADYTIRTLTVTYKGDSLTVTHYQYTTWLDKGVPKYTYPLLAFRRLIRSCDDRSTGPIIVHCSAGIGRTGTFIALDSLLDMGQAEGEVDVFGFVSQMRTERMHMIQTQGQYVFLYHALLDGLQTGHLAYPVSKYPAVYKSLSVDDTDWTEMKKQYQTLESVKPAEPVSTCDGLKEINKAKNQTLDVIPDDNHRPYLSRLSSEASDYINAVYVDSFRRENGYLLTQMPLPNTIVDFWRLVYDQECPTIIMLDEVDSQDCTPYWPVEDDPKQTHGSLTVESLKEKPSIVPDVTESELCVYITAEPKKVHKVKQYQLMSGWPNTDRLPSSTNTLLRLMELVNRPVSEDDYSGPVILQCM
ncbi:Receptor-type tyrosine-protein phosphatase T [Lamellibrachia satsuma]|nr:Receptor-type tyrosine-protein phosphatase T [Lamellibrachia satsuma]